jgi:hypothetical protein
MALPLSFPDLWTFDTVTYEVNPRALKNLVGGIKSVPNQQQSPSLENFFELFLKSYLI